LSIVELHSVSAAGHELAQETLGDTAMSECLLGLPLRHSVVGLLACRPIIVQDQDGKSSLKSWVLALSA
jgi:hypothetical protein